MQQFALIAAHGANLDVILTSILSRLNDWPLLNYGPNRSWKICVVAP